MGSRKKNENLRQALFIQLALSFIAKQQIKGEQKLH